VREGQPVISEIGRQRFGHHLLGERVRRLARGDDGRHGDRTGWRQEKHAVVRFSAVLLPGQSQLISVPVAIGEPQQVLRIRRLGDQIEVARVAGSA
jgi:hypothetical protein